MKRNHKKRKLILAIVATDSTFEKAIARGETVWAGNCLHCNGHITIAANGDPITRSNIEHIHPRNHGGTDDLMNLALACARCNGQKSRHDRQRANDPTLLALVAALLAKRKDRWREPVPV